MAPGEDWVGRRDGTIEVMARLKDTLVMWLVLICRPCVSHPR